MNLFERYITEELRYQKSTYESYQQDVNQFKDWLKKKKLRQRSVTHLDIITYLEYLNKKGYSYLTIKLKINVLNHYYNFLNVKLNPTQNIKLKGREQKLLKDVLNQEEIVDLYQSIKLLPFRNEATHLRNIAIIGLICFQGVKASELTKIKVCDVNLDGLRIKIPHSKRANERILQINAHQVIDLLNYLNKGRSGLLKKIKKEDSEYLFVGNKRENDLDTILDRLNKYLKKKTNKFENFNQIRSSVIVGWLKTENLRLAQYKSGHKHVSSTEKFKVNDISELQQKILVFHPLS